MVYINQSIVLYILNLHCAVCSLGGAVVKNPPANAGDAGDMGSIPGSGLSPGGGNGNPLQDSCCKIPLDRGTWQAVVHGVAKSLW